MIERHQIPFDLKRFGEALTLIEIRLVDLERHPDARAHVLHDYKIAMAAHSMLPAAQRAQVSDRLTAIQERLAVLTQVDQSFMERYHLLETFFADVVSVTIFHHADNSGRASVSPRVLGEMLAKVDPRWHEKKQ
jgi:hypothetical protein